VLERRRSCASHVCASVRELGVSSALGKGGEAVDSNGCSILPDLNEVCASRVGTLIGEAGIGESKL